MPDPAMPAPRRRFTFGLRALVVLLSCVVVVDLWAMSSTDPDFFLPDVFRPITLVLVAVFVLSGFVSHARARGFVRTFAAVVVVALMIFEVQSRARDSGEPTVEITADRLLRYRYRPGAVVVDGPDHHSMTVNHLGLWDREYEIPRPPDVYRIVVLTGSIANDGSIPFDARFHEVLERNLADLHPDGRRVEVLNASCDGWNTTQQVRFLEQYAMEYQPDLVIVAYMLTSAAIQNGAYRRIGNSFFTFRFLPLVAAASSGSMCSVFAPFHDRYTFDLVVRNAFERLALLRELHHFDTFVAVLPVLERFDDPECGRLYDRVVTTARESHHDAIRVVDAFAGESYLDYVKPDARMDLAHPNVAGHTRIAEALEREVRARLAAP